MTDPVPTVQVWYRYWDTKPTEGTTDLGVRLQELNVLRETEKTVVLDYSGTEKRVLKNARKRWAYPTIKLARDSFRIRKKKQFYWVREKFERIDAICKALEAGTAFELDLDWR